MYFLASEHNPSHIHAYYGGSSATLIIATGEILDGSLPNNALKLVREWLGLHRDEYNTCGKLKNLKRLRH